MSFPSGTSGARVTEHLEPILFKGNYYDGRKDLIFDDGGQLKAGGDEGCSQQGWHKFDKKKANEGLRAHVHMKMCEVAYSLNSLDQTKEANGQSLLQNPPITISAESGDGRHSKVKGELSGVFHAITGGNGRFRTDEIMDVKAEGSDVCNTMIHATGSKSQFGPDKRDRCSIEQIRA